MYVCVCKCVYRVLTTASIDSLHGKEKTGSKNGTTNSRITDDRGACRYNHNRSKYNALNQVVPGSKEAAWN